MKGCLIINAFLDSQKFNEIYDYLRHSFAHRNTELDVLTNTSAKRLLNGEKVNYDFILFWDKDIYLCQELEIYGYRVFNNSKAIALCDDKYLTYLELLDKNIKMPKTISAPLTYPNVGYADYNFIHEISQSLGYPLIIKENSGSFGKQVYLANNYDEAVAIAIEIGIKPFLFQEYVKASHGRDIRVQVIGGEVVAAVLRTSKKDFRANVTSGGTMSAIKLTQSQQRMALEVSKLLGLDFGGVDILFGDNDEPILCEVNSNAHFKNLFQATGVNSADYIAEYIINTCK